MPYHLPPPSTIFAKPRIELRLTPVTHSSRWIFSRPCFESHARDAPLDRAGRTRIGVPSWLKRGKKKRKGKRRKERRRTSPVQNVEDERGRTREGGREGEKKKREIELKGSERETWKRREGRRRKGILHGKKRRKERRTGEKEEDGRAEG